jgi:hypothetical protein
VEDLIEPVRGNALRQVAQQTAEAVEGLSSSHAKDRLEREMQDEEEAWQTEMTAVEADLSQTWSGQPDEVMDQFDPRTVTRIGLQTPAHRRPAASIAILIDQEGCILRVRGEDPKWVRGAIGTLESEIKKSVPWWHRLRADELHRVLPGESLQEPEGVR